MISVPIKFKDFSVFDDATIYEDNHAYRKDLASGDAVWIANYQDSNKHAALEFICPCGCGSVHCVSVCEGTKEGKHWLWNGDAEKPTLTPSIQCLTSCRWHGYLTDGVFVPC